MKRKLLVVLLLLALILAGCSSTVPHRVRLNAKVIDIDPTSNPKIHSVEFEMISDTLIDEFEEDSINKEKYVYSYYPSELLESRNVVIGDEVTLECTTWSDYSLDDYSCIFVDP